MTVGVTEIDEQHRMLLEKIGYPEYTAQKQAHTAFITQLEKIKKEYQASGGNFAVIMSANKLMIEWLTQHIWSMDKKIVVFAKSKGK